MLLTLIILLIMFSTIIFAGLGAYYLYIPKKMGRTRESRSRSRLGSRLRPKLSVPRLKKDDPDTIYGFGASATGGKGGKIYYVTTLKDSGSGSLRAGMEIEKPTIIKFKVHGTIFSKKYLIPTSNTTIDGSDAPGKGICIAGEGIFSKTADNVIIRYIRVRPGKDGSGDGISFRGGQRIVVDHCSVSFWSDECLSIKADAEYYEKTKKFPSDFTVSNCIFSYGLEPHNFGTLFMINGGGRMTMCRNLWSHMDQRPKFADKPDLPKRGQGVIDFSNNLMFDYDNSDFIYTQNQEKISSEHGLYVNVENNQMISTSKSPGVIKIKNNQDKVYLKGNYLDGKPGDWNAVLYEDGEADAAKVKKISKRYNFPKNYKMELIPTKSLEKELLSHIGCSKPARDDLDKIIISNYVKRKNVGIEHEDDVGGWPKL